MLAEADREDMAWFNPRLGHCLNLDPDCTRRSYWAFISMFERNQSLGQNATVLLESFVTLIHYLFYMLFR